jgi:putative hydrolase of the HAD superfamily
MNLLIWDFDGTLAHRPGNWSGALLDILDSHDPEHRFTREHIVPHLQTGFPWHEPERTHHDLATGEIWWLALQPVFARTFSALGYDGESAGRLAAKVQERYCDIATWSLYPETLEVLRELADDGYTHAILSNHVPELPAIVEQLGIGSLVDTVATSAAIGVEKPHPEAFAHLVANYPDASSVWMIGDSLSADVLGAERAGIPGILVRRESPEAPRQCSDLRGVRALLESS